MTRRVAVLGVAAADAEAAGLADAEEVVVLDPSPADLLALVARVRDPRWSFLLGALPVLPLPDAWVDEVVGTDTDEDDAVELRRVRR